MKILLLTILLSVLTIWSAMQLAGNDDRVLNSKKILTQYQMSENYLYTNEKYRYQVTVPAGFEIDDQVPELVSVESYDRRIRINVGCLDFGTEGLQPIAEPVILSGIPALKEDYYDDVALRLRRVTLHREENQCLALEEVAQTEDGWQELQRIRKTFRFVD